MAKLAWVPMDKHADAAMAKHVLVPMAKSAVGRELKVRPAWVLTAKFAQADVIRLKDVSTLMVRYVKVVAIRLKVAHVSAATLKWTRTFVVALAWMAMRPSVVRKVVDQSPRPARTCKATCEVVSIPALVIVLVRNLMAARIRVVRKGHSLAIVHADRGNSLATCNVVLKGQFNSASCDCLRDNK
jgi:hypothetical protein